MRFDKPALSVADLTAQLQAKGLQGDPARIANRLEAVGYYRLSPYWHTYRRTAPDGTHTLRPGTKFEAVWELYTFDRELRLLVMDVIERVEVALRSQLGHAHAAAFGPFGYAEQEAALHPADPGRRAEFLTQLDKEVTRALQDDPVRHFRAKYGDQHPHLPIWVATELMSFGQLLTLYRGSPRQVRLQPARFLDVPEDVLGSWLMTLNLVRNICAHHGRLWNRDIRLRPKLPRNADWQALGEDVTRRVFGALTILAHCLRRIAAGSGWGRRIQALLAAHPNIPRERMGVPEGWETLPQWAPLLTDAA